MRKNNARGILSMWIKNKFHMNKCRNNNSFNSFSVIEGEWRGEANMTWCMVGDLNALRQRGERK